MGPAEKFIGMAFIVFEGLDASGKSTLIKRVTDSLTDRGLNCHTPRDPGSTELGEKLRGLILATDIEAPVPRAEILMYQAARVQMVEKSIQPALARGQWVLCDRFHSSTVAFQSFARGLDLGAVEQLNHFVAHDCVPDLYVFLDISVEESAKRKAHRAKETGGAQDRLELEKREFHDKVRSGYLYLSDKDPDRWLVLDGSRTPDQLLTDTLSEIKKRGWLDA